MADTNKIYGNKISDNGTLKAFLDTEENKKNTFKNAHTERHAKQTNRFFVAFFFLLTSKGSES